MIDRLESTYSDFITGIKGYDKIPQFFRDHLYSPPNKEARDAALDQLYSKLRSVTGEEMTANIHKLILLNRLTDELDLDTARIALRGPLRKRSLEGATLSVHELNDCVARAGRFEDRITQVQMVADSLGFFFTLSKLPLIRLVMAPIKVAASMVGAMELVSTMEAGYDVSRGIKDMRPFMDAWVERETARIEDLAGKKPAR
ncbi:MAG: hypothetical protein K1X75_12100 [Leptospirales bacterium]|nr:hypothetical protein [Leptospirales bacterium]